MAERKSVNKYYPPDWDPSKGSVNKYVGQHPLRDRAKKLGQGILVIRFELPYNIWCGGCGAHVGMGVRYNAEKTKTGNYYSTPIYKFRMKCHLCDNYFEIQTDPKNHDYVILDGARRKEQRWDPKENEQIVPEDKATQKKMATDAMFKLEHKSDDVDRGKKVLSNLGMLEVRRDEWKDDYILNKIARNKFREEKKCIAADEASDNALLSKSSLEIPLLKETSEDIKLAGLMKYRTLVTYEEKKVQKRKEIESRPLFATCKKAKGETPENKNKLDIIKNQLKNSKNKSPSPFDSGKMIGKNASINKAAFGIVQKCKPSYSGFVVKKGYGKATTLNKDTIEEESCLPQKEIAKTDINETSSIDGIDINHSEHSDRNETCTNPGNSESDFQTVENIMEVNKESTKVPEVNDSLLLPVNSNSNSIEDGHVSDDNKPPLVTNSQDARTDKTHDAGNLDSTGHTNIINLLDKSTTDAGSEIIEQREDGQNLSEQDVKTDQQSNAIQSKRGLSLVSMYDNSDTDSSCG